MNFSKFIIVLLLVILIYTIIILLSDVTIILDNFRNIKLEYVVTGILAVFAGLFIRVIRWTLMLKTLNINIDLKSSILIYFSGSAFGLSPGRLGEVMKSHYLKRLVNAPITKTAPTIIIERFLDVFAILIIAVTSFLLIGTKHEIIWLGYVLIGVFLFFIYQKKYLVYLLEALKNVSLLGKISKKLIPSIDIIYILLQPKIFAKTLSLSIISWSFESLVVYFTLRSFGIELSIIKSAFIFVISSLVGSLSFLPGGIGATEGGLLALFLLEGISYDDSIGPVIIIRIIILLLTIIFGIIINRYTESTILKNK